MSSYYKRIEGTLNTGQTARSSDIHVIQSEIQDAIQQALIDVHGTGVVLGEDEDALKLEPTTQHIDQSDTNFDEEHQGLSCYEVYFRQPINIEKSSIELIRLEMLNNSNVEVNVYAEIQDANFNTIAESNSVLKVTDPNTYEPIDFVFSQDHLPLGRYYFILRPVDISSVDLAINGDEVIYDTINPSMFKVKYDSEGTYSTPEENEIILYEDTYGLEASYDGNEFYEARYLEEAWIDSDSDSGSTIAERNFDLYFEHIFSSGNTYLINNGAAIVLGEKVYPLDTHVTIDGPSVHGDRTDLVILTTDGQLNVIKGTVYNGEKIYPVDSTGLKIAYITTYKYGLSEDEKANILNGVTTLSEIENQAYNRKVPSIEQDDENNMTRQRDILERLRRLEKKITYQQNNNSPTRIKYNCTVDPVLANNGVDEDASIRGEGSYGLTKGQSSDGSTALVTGKAQTYSWSITDSKYSYNTQKEASTVKGELVISDVHMPLSKPKNNILPCMKCEIQLVAPGYLKAGENYLTPNPQKIGGVPYAKINVTIKKGSSVIDTYTVKTNNYGTYTLSLWNTKKLKQGASYKIFATYNGKTVKSTMKVYANNHSFSNVKVKTHSVVVDVKTVTAAQSTQSLTPTSNFFVGDDSFYKDKVNVDTDLGEVTIQRIGDTGEYEKNKLLKDMKVFSSSERIYKLKSDKKSLTSEYPVLNFTLKSDTYIKKITPYVTKFKNLDKFRIIIFKNDFIFDKQKNVRKIIQKKVTKKDNIFPTVYDSGWQSLSSAVKAGDGYKKLKKPVTFDIKKEFKAGTYSLVVWGHISSKHKEGAVKILEYVTRDYKKEYGISTKCTGGSQLSVLNMDINNLTNRSWDLLIEQRPYKYYGSGILISKSIDTSSNIKGCTVGKKSRNFKIPNGCSIKLYVSNNGGTSWINADSGSVTFDGDGHSFRWKLEMTSNSTSTPKLYYDNIKKYAISFNLAESSTYVPYEDYQKCYETPLLNANAITRSFVGNNLIEHRFSEWEFARLYIEDDELQSKIDILFSYDDNDNTTNVSTNKANWGNNIFFSQIFADLTLNDFSQESVDYDNYKGNVEYDEHNYCFNMDSEYIMHYTGGNALASPDVYYEKGALAPYEYGDISAIDDEGNHLNEIHSIFEYDYINKTYQYKGNEDDSTKKYSGMHITDGPMWQAVLKDTTAEYTSNDVVIGVKFHEALDVTENMTYVTLGLTPVINKEDGTATDITTTEEELYFPPGTFDVVVAINKNGEVDESDATNGKAYIINKKLVANEYNEVTVSFIDDLDGFEASGIGSIGIRIRDPSNFNEGDGIQLGRITTGSYNMRPYVPYMYTGKWSRLGWQAASDCKAYAMYKLGRKNAETTSTLRAFYPITEHDKDAIESKITFNDDDTISATYTNSDETTTDYEIPSDGLVNKGQTLYLWNNHGTARKENTTYTQSGTVIKREGHEITTKINTGGGAGTYVTKDTGNQTLFYLPPNKTGILFTIETNIPYTIYDLIDIEYYIFTTYKNGTDNNSNKNTNIQTHNESGTDYTYHTHGNFSKGDIYINFYDTKDIERASPVESFALPAWGRIQTSSYETNKVVHSWFKKRSDAIKIKTIAIERRNPRKDEKEKNNVSVGEMYLMLNNILLFNAETEAALGPQMQMRIYPNATSNLSDNTKIRKVGGIYRI